MTTNEQKMCGFVGLFDIRQKSDALRTQVLKMSKNIRHRGPDWSGVYCGERAILSHERLSIVDPQSGGQPLFSRDGKLVLAVNGEIYNHREIRDELAGEYDFRTGSDCEVILPLYQKMGVGLLEKISGIFAFALYDIENDEYLIARDPIGVIPLYIGWDRDEQFYVASELKALEGVCTTIQPFLPGHYWSSKEGKMVRWYDRDWFEYDAVKETGADIPALRAALEAAVKRQLMSDVPYCCREVSTRRSSRPWRGNSPTGASNRTTATGRGGPGSTPSPSDSKAPPTSRRPARWPTGSAPCTTKSTIPFRRVWTPCAT